jgi:hypothetical protein
VAETWALVVAVEKYLDAGQRVNAYADMAARTLAECLALGGVSRECQVVVTGSAATKAVVESRLRGLKEVVPKGTTLLAFVSTRGFSADGVNYLTAWDTLTNDPELTAVGLAELLAALHATPAATVGVFLDVAGLNGDAAAALFAESPKAVGLLSAGAGEESHATAAVKSSLFLHLVGDAAAGRATKALTPDGQLTAGSLFNYLGDELPRLLRKHFDTASEQTPALLGPQHADDTLLDLAGRLGGDAGGILRDPAKLLRVAFRSESSCRFKDLGGYRKGFSVPDNASASSRKFVTRLAAPDVKADLDAMHGVIRETFGTKRKDIDVSAEGDGSGQIRTPDFEYTVTAALDLDDPSKVTWTRELGKLSDVGFVRSAGFDAAFGKLFDQFVFVFTQPLDLEEMIDRLEDRPIAGMKLLTASDGESCEVTLTGFTGRLSVSRFNLTVRGRGGNSAGLLDLFLAFITHVGPLGEPLMLKG